MSLQGHRFLLGIFAGLILAAAVVAASSVAGPGTGLPFQPSGSSGALYVSNNTAEASSSTTTAVSTATMSSTTTASGAPPVPALSTTVNSTASQTTNWQAFGGTHATASSAQPSMVAGLLHSSVLALPILAALLFGLLVYRVAAKGRLD